MVQAAAMSGLNFAEANLRSRKWWIKVGWILDRLEDLNIEKVYRMQHAQHAAVLDYQIDRQAFDTHWEAANGLIREVHALNFPWAKDADKKYRQSQIEALMEQWKSIFGDPNDPEVQAKFARIAKKIREHRMRQGNNFSAVNKLRQQLKEELARRYGKDKPQKRRRKDK